MEKRCLHSGPISTESNQVGDGLRLFTSQDDASFAGVVLNDGLIAGSEDSESASGIRVDGGLNLLGAIFNEGEIRGTVNAIDASKAVTVTIGNNDEGVINGNVLPSDGADIFVDLRITNGVIDGGAGDDVLIEVDADNVLASDLGNDFIDGGDGVVTRHGFQHIHRGCSRCGTRSVRREYPGRCLVCRRSCTGQSVLHIHTAEFPAGEIRGQLQIDADVAEGDICTVTPSGSLDAAQEPGPTSDSKATGGATVVITQNLATEKSRIPAN